MGGPIPVFLTVRSSDPRALELASSGFNVQLRRVVETHSAGIIRRDANVGYKHIARAIFRPYDHDATTREEQVRLLQGEVVIPQRTTPSFTFTDITLRVSDDIAPAQRPPYPV